MEITDAKGVILQVDGLAMDRKTLIPKTVGTPLDTLVARIDYPWCYPNREKHESVVLFSTDNPHEIQKAIRTMSSKADAINQKDADYGLITSNSNSVFSQMVAAAATVVPIKPEDIKKAKSMGITNPGVDSEIKRSSESPEIIKMGKNAIEGVDDFIKSTIDSASNAFNDAAKLLKKALPKSKPESVTAEEKPINKHVNIKLDSTLSQNSLAYVPLETPFVKNNNAASKINIT